MCVIELAGLPGAGKTSIARLTSQRSKNVDLRVPSSRFSHLVGLHPVRFARGLTKWLTLRRQWSNKRALARLVRRRFRYDSVGWTRKSSSCLLLEEGLVHSIWRELFRDPSLKLEPWQELLEGYELAVVVIELPSHVAAGRIASKRQRGPINEQLVRADADQWVLAVDLYNLVLQQVPYVTVQGIENLESVARGLELSMCTSHRTGGG